MLQIKNNNSQDKIILIKFNKFSHMIGAFPIFYCNQSHKFVVASQGFKLYALPFLLFLNVIDLVYLWIWISPGISLQNVETPEFMNFYIHLISRSCGWILGGLFYYYKHELVGFSNVLFHTEQYYKGMEAKHTQKI